MNPVFVSLICCTRNPVKERLLQVLRSPVFQSMAAEDAECILVDNGSDEPMEKRFLSFIQSARVVREECVGLTNARLRGIAESRGDLVLFVDDDNVLAPNYIAETLEIAEMHPAIGAWSGNIDAEYEVQPDAQALKRVGGLAVLSTDRPKWSNLYDAFESMPTGAGLTIRRAVADRYVDLCERDPLRQGLDRRGNQLSSCGDIDIARCAIDLGYGIGRFPSLKMTHLIPANRVQHDYFVRLAYGHAKSMALLDSLRGETCRRIPWFWLRLRGRCVSFLKAVAKAEALERRCELAARRGILDALQELKNNGFNHETAD